MLSTRRCASLATQLSSSRPAALRSNTTTTTTTATNVTSTTTTRATTTTTTPGNTTPTATDVSKPANDCDCSDGKNNYRVISIASCPAAAGVGAGDCPCCRSGTRCGCGSVAAPPESTLVVYDFVGSDDRPAVDYDEAFAFQKRLLTENVSKGSSDCLCLLSHSPVYTLGRAPVQDSHIGFSLDSPPFGAKVVRTTRGGQITYHGPGQLVGYPIFNLNNERFKKNVRHFVSQIEAVVIDVLSTYGVDGTVFPDRPGVWVDPDRKVAALGLQFSKWVSMHGFSINVHANLDAFEAIVPCGLEGRTACNLNECGSSASAVTTVADVRDRVVESVAKRFGYQHVEWKRCA